MSKHGIVNAYLVRVKTADNEYCISVYNAFNILHVRVKVDIIKGSCTLIGENPTRFENIAAVIMHYKHNSDYADNARLDLPCPCPLDPPSTDPPAIPAKAFTQTVLPGKPQAYHMPPQELRRAATLVQSETHRLSIDKIATVRPAPAPPTIVFNADYVTEADIEMQIAEDEKRKEIFNSITLSELPKNDLTDPSTWGYIDLQLYLKSFLQRRKLVLIKKEEFFKVLYNNDMDGKKFMTLNTGIFAKQNYSEPDCWVLQILIDDVTRLAKTFMHPS